MAYDVNIIGTGSSGNCIVIDGSIMFDLGLRFKEIGDEIEKMDAIFITHRHGDHLNISNIKHLLKDKPWMLENNFYCNADVAAKIEEANTSRFQYSVPKKQIISAHSETDIIAGGRKYHIRDYPLQHDVENQGFVLTNDKNETLIFATDTNTMKFAPHEKFDYIVVEGNYDEDKIADSLHSDSFETRFRAVRNLRHFSVQNFEDFVHSHAKSNSKIYQLHESGTFGMESSLGLNNIHNKKHE